MHSEPPGIALLSGECDGKGDTKCFKRSIWNVDSAKPPFGKELR